MRRTLVVACVLFLLTPGPAARQEYMYEATSASEYSRSDASLRSHELMGLRAKAAERALKAAPDRAATFELLLKAGRTSAALDVLNRIVERRPAEMTAAFSAATSIHDAISDNPSRDYADRLRLIVAAAKRQLARMPREAAAALARVLLHAEAATQREPGTWDQRLRAFVAEYSGTQAALLTHVDLLGKRPGPERMAVLDEFVREHPGTVAAAKATYQKGRDLTFNGFSFGERAGHDPTERFFRVVEVYRELRSGRYPPCEWVDQALSLISDFSSHKPSYAAGSADRMMAAYEEFLPAFLEEYETGRSQDRMASLIGYRMTSLFKARGGIVGGIEAVFDRLERIARNPDAVRLLKAEVYLRWWSPESIDENAAAVLRGKAPSILESLVREASGVERRKAIVTLATLRFNEGDDAKAAPLYRAYVDDYPDSPYAWVAALRAAECEETANAKQASEMFRSAARRFGASPFARVLGHAYAGRALEATGDFRQALAEYRSALAAWDPDYGERYALGSRHGAAVALTLPGIEGQVVTHAILTDTIAMLERAVGTADGELVARARWMLAHNRWKEAIEASSRFVEKHRASPLAAEAWLVHHRARLETALERADQESAKPGDVAAALKDLEALSAEPTDFAVVGAMIARATLLALRGAAADADDAMTRAMDAWAALDRSTGRPASRDGLERDVIAIRNAVFRPKGDGVFGTGRGAWNAFEWRSARAPYFVVGSELRVKRHDGTLARVNARDSFPGLENVLFLDPGRRAILERIMTRLGGTRIRVPTAVMQTPNQPAGAALDVQASWKQRFFVQPGHWGGWVFETYPIIREIEFVDAARSRAAVRVTVGYSGATVQMEKTKDGRWVAKELTNFWIT